VAAAGLASLDALDDPRLDRYLPLHAARAELLRRIGDAAAADAAYATAIAHTDAERAALERRRDRG
jgi:RNA polymerase sigma-70 factor, ECF subfamily